jgi:hypothetical protein
MAEETVPFQVAAQALLVQIRSVWARHDVFPFRLPHEAFALLHWRIVL